MIDLHEAVTEMFSVTAWPESSRVWSHLGLYDPHPDADAWIAGDENERAEIRLRLARRVPVAQPLRQPRRQRDVTAGRCLALGRGKLTPAVVARIRSLHDAEMSERRIALLLGLSRPTVARALGKRWAVEDPRLARTQTG